MDARIESPTALVQDLQDMEFTPALRGFERRPLPRPGVEGLISSLMEFRGADLIEVWVPAKKREYREEVVDQLVHTGTLEKITLNKSAIKFTMSAVEVKDGNRVIERKDGETFEIALDHVSCEFHNGTRGLTVYGDFLKGVDWVTLGEPERW